MSLATWKKEFYGSLAKAAKSDEAAILHAIKKYEGALDHNLDKHDLVRDGFVLKESAANTFFFGSESCALCKRHIDIENQCPNCPLSQSGEFCNYGAWNLFQHGASASVMLIALRKALELVRGKKAGRK